MPTPLAVTETGQVFRCGYCRALFEASRADVIWCSAACRKAISRAGGTPAMLRARAEVVAREGLEEAARLQRAAYVLEGGNLWGEELTRRELKAWGKP